MSKSIVIVRHGETDWNARGRLNSYTDVPLNAKGKAQAQAVGRSLIDFQPDLVVVSPSLRAQQTCELLLEAATHPATDFLIDENLRELDFGRFEGMARFGPGDESFKQAFSEWIGGHGPASPHGDQERLEDATSRANAVIRGIEDSPAKRVILVSHGHFCRILLCTWVLGLGAEHHRRLRFDNARIAQVSVSESERRLVSFNSSDLV